MTESLLLVTMLYFVMPLLFDVEYSYNFIFSILLKHLSGLLSHERIHI